MPSVTFVHNSFPHNSSVITRDVNDTRNSATEEIAHDADKTAIQGHSRSSVVMPIYAAYVTSY